MTGPNSLLTPGDPDAANPLLEQIGKRVQYSEWARRLTAMPLEKVEWRHLPPAMREDFLVDPTSHYVPARTLFEPAEGIQILVRRALSLINPLRPENRVRVNEVALCESTENLGRISRADGAGALWDGVTATGRSELARRTLKILIPVQIIDYGPSAICGWTRMRQAAYLYVDHPSNGTRGGLLKRILWALDEALGTDYFSTNKRTTNIDTLLVEVIARLALHRVAILVIDENHEQSLADSPWQTEFVLFYQSAMNLGLSILLIGNPLAFTNLLHYAQIVRRLSVGGIHHFQPASSASEPWWAKDFVPRMRKFSVVEECSIAIERRNQLEFELSGGLPGLYPLISVQAQRIALRRGGETAVLTEKDLTDAAESPFFLETRRIAQRLLDADTKDSAPLSDIPASTLSRRRNPTKPGEQASTSPNLPNIDSTSFDVVKKMLANFRRQQTRATNKFAKRLELVANLSAEQRKELGLSEELEAAAAALQAQIQAASAAPSDKNAVPADDGSPRMSRAAGSKK